jgi:hypothetical protein
MEFTTCYSWYVELGNNYDNFIFILPSDDLTLAARAAHAYVEQNPDRFDGALPSEIMITDVERRGQVWVVSELGTPEPEPVEHD